MNPIVQIKNVSHTYERWGCKIQALRDLSCSIARGEWVMVIGPNGSGKSTLLKLLLGDLALQQGDISFAESLAAHCSRTRQRMLSMIHQDPTAGTAATLTVGEHLLLAETSEDKSISRSARKSRYRSLLADFQLDMPLGQPAQTLSGGQRQLLTLVMIKLRQAPILLLDEPFAALDVAKTELCFNALQKLHAEGRTLIFVTHDLNDACRKGNRTLGMRDGRIVYDGKSEARNISDLEQVCLMGDSVAR